MKKRLANILIFLLFLSGLCLILYPSLSDYCNVHIQKKNIDAFVAEVDNAKSEDIEKAKAEAMEYNAKLRHNPNRWAMSEEDREEYNQILNFSGNGAMGYIEIPVIDCMLPIYHGTSEAVLEHAIGHMEGSSVPVGGNGEHIVLSGHSGLPGAKIFTDLENLEPEDVFYLYVLGDKMTYKVDQIVVVEPDDMTELRIDTEKDYCTLITCTPYGVNSHRLLVRGKRVLED